MILETRFRANLERLLAGTEPRTVVVAVSGGGDSMALLALTCAWAGAKTKVVALTVDHGLRRESAREALWVAERAASLGATHQILKWGGWSGKGNLQAAAREARYRLISDWCGDARSPVGAVLLGHTRDDQAETFLMRLARGSGVDGLACMSPGQAPRDLFLRPLLEETRADLRDWLRGQGLSWIDDPSNDDTGFERVRMRQALQVLAPLGLDVGRLAETAATMARARTALEARAADVAQAVVAEQPGLLRFDRDALAAIEPETQLRLLAHGLKCLSGAPYRPRLSALTDFLASALEGSDATLHGCRLHCSGGTAFLAREWQAVKALETPVGGAPWDGKWQVHGPDLAGCTLRALGDAGTGQMPRLQGLPPAVLKGYPGVWDGDRLIMVPFLWNTEIAVTDYAPAAGFHRTILTH